MYLSSAKLQNIQTGHFRIFEKGECHINRTFDSSVLILMLSGVLRFTENDKDVELISGEYYIQRQGLRQEGNEPSDMPMYFYMHFDGDFTEEDTGIPIRGRFSVNDIMPYIHVFNKEKNAAHSNFFVMTGLFYSILGNLNKQNESGGGLTAHAIMQFIAEHYTEVDFSIEDIADKFSYSKDYIIRLFKKSFNMTPYQYNTQLRVEYAKQLLLSSTKTMDKISTECGYGSYSTFYKNFVNETGESPNDWKANHTLLHERS